MTATRLDEARRVRQKLAEMLRSCECLWPVEVHRTNGSGHAEDCPSHVEWTGRKAS